MRVECRLWHRECTISLEQVWLPRFRDGKVMRTTGASAEQSRFPDRAQSSFEKLDTCNMISMTQSALMQFSQRWRWRRWGKLLFTYWLTLNQRRIVFKSTTRWAKFPEWITILEWPYSLSPLQRPFPEHLKTNNAHPTNIPWPNVHTILNRAIC